jgi:hypothetical protein
MKRIAFAVLAAALLLAVGATGASAVGHHDAAPRMYSAAVDEPPGGHDSENSMTAEEWYSWVMPGQHQGNVQWACDCHGFVLATWRGWDRHMRKEVEYPTDNSDGTTSPYGDIIRYRQGRYGHWTTDKVKYMAVEGTAFPFYYDAAGNAETR